MHNTEKIPKQGDKLLKMPGRFDRGPIEFKSHIVNQEGEVMAIATRNVISVPPSMSILGAVETMTRWEFRRLPVIDAGSRRIRGILTSGDIINFLGGGDKFNLVQVKHGGNLLAAINENVRTIMTQALVTLPHTATIREVTGTIVGRKIGGLPIVGQDSVLVGIVTERDVLRSLAHDRSPVLVEDVMSTGLRVTGPDSTLGQVTREMTAQKFRRLPVVSDDVLYGIITTTDIMAYLGSGDVFPRLITGDVSEMMALPVRELVSGPLYTTTPEKPVTLAAQEMLKRDIGALPVIENNRLIGLVTEFDLIRAFCRGD